MSDASALPTAIPAATNPATPSTSNSSNIELTPAQKKALAKAEKAARRAEKVTAKETPPTPSVAVESSAPKTNGVHPQKQKAGASVVATGKAQDAPSTTTPKARRPSVIASGVQVRDLPERLRRDARGNVGETKNTVNKEIGMFSHLYNQPRKHTLEGSAREVHPAILELGLQLSSYVICGSQARCIAMLLALKSVRLSSAKQ
jgi:translation initiation factor eIF-2B subunit delta